MSISFFGFRYMCIAPQSLGGCPEGTWINAVRMQCQHLLVKIHSGRCTRRDLVEVADITARFLDVMGRAIGIKHAMTGYHRFRMQSFDFIERAKPLVPGLFIALGEIRMHVVVDSIAGYDQANRRNVQSS